MADSTDTSAESCGHRQSHQCYCLIGCFRQLVGPANLLIVILGVKAAQSRGFGREFLSNNSPLKPSCWRWPLLQAPQSCKLRAECSKRQAASTQLLLCLWVGRPRAGVLFGQAEEVKGGRFEQVKLSLSERSSSCCTISLVSAPIE